MNCLPRKTEIYFAHKMPPTTPKMFCSYKWCVCVGVYSYASTFSRFSSPLEMWAQYGTLYILSAGDLKMAPRLSTPALGLAKSSILAIVRFLFRWFWSSSHCESAVQQPENWKLEECVSHCSCRTFPTVRESARARSPAARHFSSYVRVHSGVKIFLLSSENWA